MTLAEKKALEAQKEEEEKSKYLQILSENLNADQLKILADIAAGSKKDKAFNMINQYKHFL